MLGTGPWALATLLSKLVAYAGFVSLAGTLFVFWLGTRPAAIHASTPPPSWSLALRARLISRCLGLGLAALAALLLYFLLQVGQINQNGLRGIVDSLMAGIVLRSSVGYGLLLRAAALILLLAGLWQARGALLAEGVVRVPPRLQVSWFAGILLFALSFAVLGHVASLSLPGQVAIVLHTLVISLWVGALPALYRLCEREPAILVLPLLQRFGVLGWGILGGLLLSGVFLLTQLLQAPGEMLSTSYGRLLATKLLLVLGLFGLGALNKFHLVPAVAHRGADRVRQSIAVERVLAALVLVLTAALTTLTGPSHMG